MIAVNLKKELQDASGKMLLDVQFTLQKNKWLTIYGKSGAGKTTILKLLAGLEKADTGSIIVNNACWYDSDKKVNISPQKRDIGLVFQEYALFPNMTVLENLQFALPKNRKTQNIKEVIEIFDLGDLQKRSPKMLSGGQKQRVALARTLVQKPKILMLDEPLSALDFQMRKQLQDYILTAHRAFDLTTILISHDVSEIIKLSDYVIELDRGKIIQQGETKSIFSTASLSGKFKFTGEIVAIAPQDFLYIVTVLVGNDLVKVVVDQEEMAQFKLHEKVILASKAFNPILQKLTS